jgi:hypothetical protein
VTPVPAAAAATAATAKATVDSRSSFVHIERPPPQVAAVQRGDCVVRLGRIRHFNEGKSPRATRIAILKSKFPTKILFTVSPSRFESAYAQQITPSERSPEMVGQALRDNQIHY